MHFELLCYTTRQYFTEYIDIINDNVSPGSGDLGRYQDRAVEIVRWWQHQMRG